MKPNSSEISHLLVAKSTKTKSSVAIESCQDIILGGVSTPTKKVQKSDDPWKKLRRKVGRNNLDEFKEECSVTKNFSKVPEEDVLKIVSRVVKNLEIEKHKKEVYVREREYKKMQMELDRARRREHPEYYEFTGDDPIVNTRDRGRKSIKNGEYELSRYQLALAKARARLAKKQRKHGRRIVLSVPEVEEKEIEVEYQTGIATSFFSVGEEIISYIIRGIQQFVGKYPIDKIIAIVQFILSITRTKDVYIRSLSVMSLCRAFNISEAGSILAGLSTGFVQMAGEYLFAEESKVEYQSLSDVRSVIDKVLHSDLIHAVRMVFIGITSYLSFPIELSSAVFNIIGTSPLKMSVLKLIENVISVITKVTAAAALWWHGKDGEGVPISEILFGATIFDSLREEYELLELYKDSTYSGLPVKNHMCQYVYLRKSTVFIKTAKAYQENIGRHSPEYRMIGLWILKITDWSNVVSMNIMGSNRIPAFAVALVGAPCVGKSLTTKLLAARPSVIKGYRFEEAQMYSKNPADEFWEGYDPKQHNVVFFSEVAKMSKAMVEKVGDTGLDSILSCVDSNRYLVQMAFEGKGKTPFASELIIADSNNANMHFDSLYHCPAAFFRRFMFIEQSVKPEFRVEGTGQIDADKASQEKDPFVPFLYHMYKWRVGPDMKPIKYNIPDGQGVEYIKMVEIFDREFVTHQMKNSKINSTVMEFVRNVPTREQPTFFDPPKDQAEIDLMGDEEELKTEGDIQDRYLRPCTVKDKIARDGICEGTIPHNDAIPGKEVMKQCKERLRDSINEMFGSGTVPMAFAVLPAFLGAAISFPLLSFDPNYVNKIIVNKYIDDMSDSHDKLITMEAPLAAEMVSDLEALMDKAHHFASQQESVEFTRLVLGLDAQLGMIEDDICRGGSTSTMLFFESILGNLITVAEKSNIYVTHKERAKVNEFVDSAVSMFHNLYLRRVYVRHIKLTPNDVILKSLNKRKVPKPCSLMFTVPGVEKPVRFVDLTPEYISLIRRNGGIPEDPNDPYVIAWNNRRKRQDHVDNNDIRFELKEELPLPVPEEEQFEENNLELEFKDDVPMKREREVENQSGLSRVDFERFGEFCKDHLFSLLTFVWRILVLELILWAHWLYKIKLRTEYSVISVLMWRLGWLPWYFLLPLLLYIYQPLYNYLVKELVVIYARKRRDAATAMVYDVVDSFRSRIQGVPRNLELKRGWIYGFAGASMVSIIAIGYTVGFSEKVQSFFPNKKKSYQASFSKMQETFDEAGCEAPQRRIKLRNDPLNWNVQTALAPRYVFTQSLEDFSVMIRSRTSFLWFESKPGYRVVSHGVGVCKNHMLINTHFLMDAIEQKARIWASDQEDEYIQSFEISTTTFYRGSNDITLTTCGRNFRDLIQHMAIAPIGSSQCLIGGQKVSAVAMPMELQFKYDTIKFAYTYSGYCKKGLCGNLLLTKFGNGCAIIGMHMAGDRNGENGYSTMIVRSEIEKYSALLEQENVLFTPLSGVERGIEASSEECKINPKSPFSHVSLPCVEYHGTIERAEVSKKSSVEPNIYKDVVDEIEDVMDIKCTKEFGPPVMMPYVTKAGVYMSPQNNALIYFCKPPVMTKEVQLKKVVFMLQKSLLIRLEREGKKRMLTPYKMLYAVNGSKDDAYLRRINASTAAGYPLKGKKSDHLILQPDNYTRVPTDHVMILMNNIINEYREGKRSASIFSVALKDEPTTKKKIDAGQTRLFYVHPLPHLILCRMFLGPFVTLMQESDAFYSMVGINMYNDAEKVFERLKKHPWYIEADAKKFDISVAYIVRSASFSIVMGMLKALGYNDVALKITRGLLTDLLNPLYLLDGDLFSKSSVPSGHYGTAELNCLIILTIMALTFIEGVEKGKIDPNIDFFEHVSAAIYGDDQSASVSDEVKDAVNNITIAKVYSDVNMELTASDKASELLPFVPLKDATFLKRSIVCENNYVYAPLDPNSIYKMSSWSLKPDTTLMERDLSIANSALLEWFLHCETKPCSEKRFGCVRDIYYKRYQNVYNVEPRNMFNYDYIYSIMYNKKRVENQSDSRLCPYNITVWAEDGAYRGICVDSNMSLFESHECAMVIESGRSHPGLYKTIDEGCADEEVVIPSALGFRLSELKTRKYVLQEALEVAEKEFNGYEPLYDISNPGGVKYTNRYASDPQFRGMCDEWLSVYAKWKGIECELKCVSELIRKEDMADIEMQSGELSSGEINPETKEKHQNLEEFGGDETKMIDMPTTGVQLISVPQTLDDFFARPIAVGGFAMTVGGTYENVYDVFDLVMSNPAVRAKLRNYAFFRADPCIRISVSGTPFDAGRIMVSAQPWAETNQSLTKLFTLGATWDKLKLQYLSQASLTTTIDIKENKPVDILMPWVSPMPIGRLFNNSSSALSSATSLDDYVGMWKVYMKTQNAMTSASATPAPVYVYVYVYLKNVQVGITTGTQMDIVTQSDERKVGPIEKVSSSLFNVSKALENVPMFKTYAKASSMFLSGVKNASALFGWSAPIMHMKPQRMKNEPYQNGSYMIQMDTGQRMTWDPDQELAVSTEYVSKEKDELIIADICRRPCFLKTFTWQASAAPKSELQTIFIHPRLSSGVVGNPSGKKNIVPTPMEQMSQMFCNWHGEIHIVLEVVTNSFTRGKLLLTYDPNVAQYANIKNNVDLNKQYTHVWDIQETQRYTVCVPWNHARMWADNLGDADAFSLIGTALSPQTTWFNAVNGFLFIAPFTKLQTPDGSDISINVYVYAEDMEFNRVTINFMPKNRAIDYQSGEYEVSNIEESCIPISTDSVSAPGLTDHFFGERILSLRSLFKRFVQTRIVSITPAANSAYVYRSTCYPDNPCPIGTDGTATVVGLCPYNHNRACFLAQRGSTRHRVHSISDAAVTVNPCFVFNRDNESSTNTTCSTSAITGFNSFLSGNIVFVPSTNGGIEFEVPFYSNNYFVWSDTVDPYYTRSGLPFDNFLLRGFSVVYYPPGTPSVFYVMEEFATGEDFQMSFWLGTVPYVSS